jgi:hypothetical protein
MSEDDFQDWLRHYRDDHFAQAEKHSAKAQISGSEYERQIAHFLRQQARMAEHRMHEPV